MGGAGAQVSVPVAPALPSTAPTWEMRVCADPDSMPFSDQTQAGFENRIAAVLADELDAKLTFQWWTQDATLIPTQLREGHCDLIMGIPDGFEDLLSTIAYYRSPYVFIYRSDSSFEVASFDDPVLHDLRIGVQSTGSPPHDALVSRGLTANINLSPGRFERIDRVIDAVVNGEIDIGLAWGAAAGYYAASQPVPLKMVPVSPLFDLDAGSMLLSMTIALRPGDEAFRDRLDIALANRWDEIQGILGSYDVPLAELPRPVSTLAAEGLPGSTIRIGVAIPARSGGSTVPASINDFTGEAARMGAILAQEVLDSSASGADLKVLLASTPNAAAAQRAAERLQATENIHALIGGIGEGQAQTLARVAVERDIPFFNIGSTGQALRDQDCNPNTFHIEASAGMYLDTLAASYAQEGQHHWFVLHEASVDGEQQLALFRNAVGQHSPDSLPPVGLALPSGQFFYRPQLDLIAASGADTVLLLLDPRDQLAFLTEAEDYGLDAAVAVFPDPVTQTRDYLGAVLYRAPHLSQSPRIALWEATLRDADGLNERFHARWGMPLNPTGWAAFESVRILYDSFRKAGDTEGVIAYLEDPLLRLDTAKGNGLSFQPGTRQLLQPLYVVQIDATAEHGYTHRQQLRLVELLGEYEEALGSRSLDRQLLICRP